jgi:hypothetical protein
MLLPILLGGLIYVIYRTPDTRINEVIYCLYPKFVDISQTCRQQLPLSDTFIYQFPGGLWLFSATLATLGLNIYWSRHRLPLHYLPLAYGFLLEYLQYAQVTDGTFDAYDLCYYFIFWGLARLFQVRYLPLLDSEIPRRRGLRLVLACCMFLVLFLGDRV